jgi:acetylornithine/N-succinyldiaminopimelate aminotransferase
MTHATDMHAPDDMNICPLMPTYGPPAVMFVRGEGANLWDNDGKGYLDFLSGIAVCSLGHSHPVVAKAIAEQASKLQHVSNLFATEHNWDVALTLDRLIRSGHPVGGQRTAGTGRGARASEEAGAAGPQLGGQQGQTFFANSGAEANEAAIKLARKWGGRGRHVVITAMRSFHGRTLATLAATGQPEKHEPFQPLPEGFRHVALNDISELDKAMDETVAAVLLEPIQGEGGINPLDDGYLAAVRALCDERGTLLMMDEVQMGLGRTGEWFGHHHDGVAVDVVTVAKALGNGMPIGACWARAAVADAFKPGDHATTYGGQPLATAAAKATLQVLEEIDAPARARTLGASLTEALEARAWCDHVRGRGLLLAVELTDAALGGRSAGDVGNELLAAGLVVGGSGPTALRLAPPLIIDQAQVDEALSIIDRVMGGS